MKLPDPIQQNADTIIGEEKLARQLQEKRPLRIKLGVDPTRPDLTFGHMVVFNKLRQFQALGHQAILIIGDFTTLIGDPSGRSATRPVLGKKEIRQNAETYLDQAFKILDQARTTVRYNSEWFSQMRFEDCLQLARKMTVARMLERDDFSKRYARNTPISLVEFLYPLVQGHDSLMIEADVELGGTDQLFNMLVGRTLQKDAGQPEQAVITLPLLIGLDGEKKMSKSLDNYIAFNDTPKDMFGKLMSIKDEQMWDYYRLLLNTPPAQIESLKQEHPMQAKKQLAVELITQLHGEAIARHEMEQFEQVFSQHQAPDQMPAFPWADLCKSETTPLLQLLAATGLFPSKKEARRLVEQGAVRLNAQPENDPFREISRPTAPLTLQAGKRKFFKILP